MVFEEIKTKTYYEGEESITYHVYSSYATQVDAIRARQHEWDVLSNFQWDLAETVIETETEDEGCTVIGIPLPHLTRLLHGIIATLDRGGRIDVPMSYYAWYAFFGSAGPKSIRATNLCYSCDRWSSWSEFRTIRDLINANFTFDQLLRYRNCGEKTARRILDAIESVKAKEEGQEIEERESDGERRKASLVAARAMGRFGSGQTKLDAKQQAVAVQLYREGKQPVDEICRIMGISQRTLYRYVRRAEGQ